MLEGQIWIIYSCIFNCILYSILYNHVFSSISKSWSYCIIWTKYIHQSLLSRINRNLYLSLLLLQALSKRCNIVAVEMLHTVTNLQSLFQRRAEKWHLHLLFWVRCGNVSQVFQPLMLSLLLSFSIFTSRELQVLFLGAEKE